MTRSFNDFSPSAVLSFTSDRSVDFSLKNVPLTLSKIQREHLSKYLDIQASKFITIRQVHEDNVIVIEQGFDPLENIAEADAVLTRQPQVVLTVRTADCLPVFLFDPETKSIGLVHAGWRGSQKGIAAKTVGLMREKWRVDPANLKAAFGPAIRSCCYEVGKEFKDHFPGETEEKNGKLYLDLIAVNKDQLVRAGVSAQNILDSNICTFCDKNCFSYRREGEKAGRMISVMMLK